MEIGKADFSAYNYQSPVELIAGEVKVKMENHVVSVVQKMGVNVDKDELLRALAYDREQYEKGYASGYAQREREIIRCRDCKYSEECCRTIRSYGRRPDDFCSYGERKEVDE